MTIPSFENVAVMGAGAVGAYFGAMLARAGAQVRLIGRGPRSSTPLRATGCGLRASTSRGA